MKSCNVRILRAIKINVNKVNKRPSKNQRIQFLYHLTDQRPGSENSLLVCCREVELKERKLNFLFEIFSKAESRKLWKQVILCYNHTYQENLSFHLLCLQSIYIYI